MSEHEFIVVDPHRVRCTCGFSAVSAGPVLDATPYLRVEWARHVHPDWRRRAVECSKRGDDLVMVEPEEWSQIRSFIEDNGGSTMIQATRYAEQGIDTLMLFGVWWGTEHPCR